MLTTFVIRKTSGEYKRRMMWDEFFYCGRSLTFGDITFCCIICFKGRVVKKEIIFRPI
jgi:hypothetical protein